MIEWKNREYTIWEDNASIVERHGTLEHDKILDDQALVIKLKEKGLVKISGSSHAGIVNTILYAKKITGINKIHAIIGGFHLQGPDFEPIIAKTIAEFKNLDLEKIQCIAQGVRPSRSSQMNFRRPLYWIVLAQ